MNTATSRQRPLVSIVLPTYNRAQLLPHAINSILEQSYENFELIIVDDNSTDNTASVVRSFDEPRIRYLKNDPNLRLPRALNRGFSQAKGEFLTWTSDDNLLSMQAIDKMVIALQAGDCDLVYADYCLFSDLDDEARPIEPCRDKLPDEVQLEKGNHIGACFLYTRKLYETVGDYDPELFLVEDYDYFIRASKAFRFHHIAEPLYFFRRDDNTLYHSRFAEVKCSDVLVRFKNQLITADELIHLLVHLVLKNSDQLLNSVLRRANQHAGKISFKLGRMVEKMSRRYLLARLDKPIKLLLNQYTDGIASFEATRNDIKAQVDKLATLTPH